MNRRGFTLLELLIAMVITLLLAGLILSVTTGTLSIWRRTRSSSSAAAQALLVLDQLEKDLNGAVFRNDAKAWLSLNVDNDQSLLISRGWLLQANPPMKPSDGSLKLLPPIDAANSPLLVSRARFGLSGVWLRLFATNIDASGGLPVAVSYQINRRPITGLAQASNPAEVRYMLCREELDATTTFNTLLNSGYPDKATPTALVSPSTQDAIAVNVVDFGLWLYRRGTSNELILIYPTSETSPLNYSAPQPAAMPVAADVMIRILSDDGAAQIAALESGHISRPSQYPTDAAWWWGVVEANSQVFTRRIEFKSTAL